VTQQAGATVTTYTYDPNGNLLAENEAGSITTLTWGYEDELLTAQASNGTLTTMTYDGDLKRRKRAQAASWTTYLWDGQQIVLELDKNANTTVRYTQAPRGYGDLVSQRRSSTTSFFHFDAIGTTRALTDASQSVTDTYIMRAFGTYRATTGSTVNNFRYIGRLGYYRETAVSGFLLRRRYYAPEVGRFLSRDPQREVAGTSQYSYVGNRASQWADPSGMISCAWLCAWRLGAGIPGLLTYRKCVSRCEKERAEREKRRREDEAKKKLWELFEDMLKKGIGEGCLDVDGALTIIDIMETLKDLPENAKEALKACTEELQALVGEQDPSVITPALARCCAAMVEATGTKLGEYTCTAVVEGYWPV
jgi:RHS repeat-associated protein